MMTARGLPQSSSTQFPVCRPLGIIPLTEALGGTFVPGPAYITPKRALMSYSPILSAHIFAGTLGLLSGTAAMFFRKGSPRHVLAGKIFVASMLTMGVLAVYLAVVRHQTNNIGGGILTVYLVGTGWLTARRRDVGDQSFRLDCAPDSCDARSPHLDEWSESRAQRSHFTRRSSGRNDLFHGFRDAAGRRGGRSHACARRCFWSQAHRAPSLAHVLRPIHRGRIFFPGPVKPPAEIAFGTRARATFIPGSIQHAVVFNSQRPPTGYADFLANPSSLQKCLPAIDTTRIRKSGFNAIVGRFHVEIILRVQIYSFGERLSPKVPFCRLAIKSYACPAKEGSIHAASRCTI